MSRKISEREHDLSEEDRDLYRELFVAAGTHISKKYRWKISKVKRKILEILEVSI